MSKAGIETFTPNEATQNSDLLIIVDNDTLQ